MVRRESGPRPERAPPYPSPGRRGLASPGISSRRAAVQGPPRAARAVWQPCNFSSWHTETCCPILPPPPSRLQRTRMLLRRLLQLLVHLAPLGPGSCRIGCVPDACGLAGGGRPRAPPGEVILGSAPPEHWFDLPGHPQAPQAPSRPNQSSKPAGSGRGSRRRPPRPAPPAAPGLGSASARAARPLRSESTSAAAARRASCCRGLG